MGALGRVLRFVVETSAVPRLLSHRDEGVVLMLHRFSDPTLGGHAGHDVAAIRQMLGYLRRRRFELVPLATLFDRAERGEPLHGAIAFTIDDGYLDHATIGAPAFAEFDCPVTTFVTTGFLDGTLWFWWDKIEFIFNSTRCQQISVQMGDSARPLMHEWHTSAQRDAARDAFTWACKFLSDEEKHAAIARLAEAANVEISASAPRAYAAMSWTDARRCEQTGMTFGPHTVTHPILSRVTDAQSRFEIQESWQRLSSEVTRPDPIFCYPNGEPGRDFGDREATTIGLIGLRGAVVGSRGYAIGDRLRDARDRFFVPRFPVTGIQGDLIQCVTGLERLKERIRARRR